MIALTKLWLDHGRGPDGLERPADISHGFDVLEPQVLDACVAQRPPLQGFTGQAACHIRAVEGQRQPLRQFRGHRQHAFTERDDLIGSPVSPDGIRGFPRGCVRNDMGDVSQGGDDPAGLCVIPEHERGVREARDRLHDLPRAGRAVVVADDEVRERACARAGTCRAGARLRLATAARSSVMSSFPC